jgi:hypothetical protein
MCLALGAHFADEFADKSKNVVCGHRLEMIGVGYAAA